MENGQFRLVWYQTHWYRIYTRKADWKGPNWYQIDPNIGTKISTSLTKPRHCETIASGWIQVPSTPDFGQTVESKVCFNVGNGCKYSRQIKIRNCGQYVLYYLPEAPECPFGYCVE